tara:strand:+ start:877 stop:1602 length:726 start_codon:yes stop_codon:yes gene_type:complete
MLYISEVNIGDIMKKILILISFLSIPLIAGDGPFFGFFGIKTQNPVGVIQASDQLTKDCPSDTVVRIMAENLNGDDDTTHTYVVFYENNAAYVKWSNQVQTCPGWGKYFQSMSSISEQTNQALGFPVVGGGDVMKDQVFTVFLLNVTDPSAYVKAYTELMEEQTANGQCPSSWGVASFGPGTNPEKYGTHMAYCGYPDLATAMESVNNPAPNKAYAKFLTRADNFRSLVRLNMTSVVKTYD